MKTEAIIQMMEWVPSVVGVIWVFLTILLLITIKVVRHTQNEKSAQFSNLIFLLLASCWLHPTYIFGLQTSAGFLGCFLTLAITLIMIYKLQSVSKLAASLMTPVLLWSGFASLYTFLLLL